MDVSAVRATGPGVTKCPPDDHAVVRASIKLLIELTKRYEVVGETDTGEAAVERVAPLQPDLVVMTSACRLGRHRRDPQDHQLAPKTAANYRASL